MGDARAAIVEDRARTTRDRLYGDAEWNGRRFVVVDTGGLEIAPGDPIEEQVQLQARLAISEADVIVFLVDAEPGPTPADTDAADLLRRTTKPVLVAANKADNEKRELDAAEFYSFGWEDTFAISATTGAASRTCSTPSSGPCRPRARPRSRARSARTRPRRGRRRWRRARPTPYVVGARPTSPTTSDDDEDGDDDDREAGTAEDVPPAGTPRWPPTTTSRRRSRSSAARTSASRRCSTRSWARSGPSSRDIPGTTRDAIDTTIPWGRSEIVLIDTAGIRRRGKVASGPAAEKYSTMRALKAISRADVAVLVLDAHDGLTAQDAHVAGYVIEEGKGLVIAVNKWDIVEDKTHKSFDDFVVDPRAASSRSSTTRRSCRSARRPASGSRRS